MGARSFTNCPIQRTFVCSTFCQFNYIKKKLLKILTSVGLSNPTSWAVDLKYHALSYRLMFCWSWFCCINEVNNVLLAIIYANSIAIYNDYIYMYQQWLWVLTRKKCSNNMPDTDSSALSDSTNWFHRKAMAFDWYHIMNIKGIKTEDSASAKSKNMIHLTFRLTM